MPLADQVALFGHRLMAALTEAGIIGVRCAGAHTSWTWPGSARSIPGSTSARASSRAGHFLTTTGGHFLTSGHALECDGPVRLRQRDPRADQERRRPHQAEPLRRHHGPAWDRHWHSFLLDDELEAAFAICRQREFKVMAHATNPDAVKNAVRLGAHSVEHGYIMDDECIDAVPEARYLVRADARDQPPDARAGRATSGSALGGAAQPAALALLPRRRGRRRARRWFRRALDAGVKMALGSDIRPLKDAALLEMGLWVKDGATPWQTLLAATRHAAAICGVGADLGTVEVGKLADLIVVGANPLEDINNVRRLLLVLKEGRIVSDKRCV